MGDWSMAMILSMFSVPRMRSCGAERASGGRQPPGVVILLTGGLTPPARQSFEQDVVDQRTFAGAANAGDADEQAERYLHVDVFEVVLPCADDLNRLAGPRPALLRHLDPARAGEVLSREAVLVGKEIGVAAGRHHLAAAHAGAGAEIDDVVGGPHRVLVVLDDDDGVAHVAQAFQAPQQSIVVARVQADRRLVEDVEDADEATTDLPGQADALGLAAGQGRRTAVERQVVQADVEQEADPAADFLQHLGGNLVLERRKALFQLALLRIEPLAQVADGHGTDFGKHLAADAHSPGLRVEPLALAAGTAADTHVLFHRHAPWPRRGLLEAAQQLRNDPLPGAAVLPDAVPLFPFVGDVPVAAAVEQQVAVFLRQVPPGRLQVDAERAGHALVDVPAPAAHALDATDQWHRSVPQAERVVGDQQVRLEGVALAQAVAIGAHPLRVVEAEELRAGRLIALFAVSAGVMGGKEDVVVFTNRFPLAGARGWFFHRDNKSALAQRQRLLHSFRQAGPDFRIDLEPIDDNLDMVLDLPLKFEVVGQADHLAVHAGADEATLQHVLKEVLVLPLLSADHRRQYQEAGSLRQGEDAGDDLLARLGGDGPAALGAVPLADARIKDAQVIGDLGDGADGRARVTAGRLLLDADRWR